MLLQICLCGSRTYTIHAVLFPFLTNKKQEDSNFIPNFTLIFSFNLLIIIIYRIHKVLYSLLSYEMENNYWWSLDEPPLHELFFTHSVGKSFLHLGSIFWWPALPSLSYHLIKHSWINGQDESFFATISFPLEGIGLPFRIHLYQGNFYLINHCTIYSLWGLLCCLTQKNVVVAGPCGDLSRKAINSDWFSHVNLVYLYLWMPEDSWRNRHPASCSLGH